MNATITKYRDALILAGLLVGALYIFEVLPATTDIIDLNENVKYVYLAIIIGSAYTYHTQFFGKRKEPSILRKVAPTIQSSSGFRKRMAAQRGNIQKKPLPQQPSPPPTPPPRPSDDMLETFGKQ